MNTVNDSAIKKLKLLITVVDRPKGEFYLDVISQFDVNCQLAMAGLGTAASELVELLGLEPQGRDPQRGPGGSHGRNHELPGG